MREYKFRGKRIDNDEWVEGYLDYRNTGFFIHVMEECPPTYTEPGGEWIDERHEVDPKTVGQAKKVREEQMKLMDLVDS